MKLKLGQFVVLSVLVIAPASLLAHEDATGVVKERMDLMESQKDAMKVIGDMAKGKVPFDAAKAAAAANDIEVTSQEMTGLFPEGSAGHPSEAKPEVWTQWDEFVADAKDLEKAAATLKTALADESPEWKANFKGVIDSCKACHKTFRMKKKK